MFRVTARLLDCRITFFSRSPCGLCDAAKAVVQRVKETRPLQYKEINVMEPGQEKWKEVYEFDTPVVSNHRNTLIVEYLSGRLDPCRQSKRPRNNNLIVKAYASLQGRRSDQIDGRSRAIIGLHINGSNNAMA